MSGIGLLNEKALHASLKQWYARQGDRFEVPVNGYVIDIVRDDLLIEIQTGNFASIKWKLTNLVHSHQVRLVYPIVQEKWITRPATDDHGRVIRRKSPKRGRLEDLFREMVGGWAIEARRLLEVLDQRLFKESADWRGFLPQGLESFTTRDLATAMDTGRDLAQKMAYCLREGKVIELIGRRERANLYRVAGV